MDLRDEAPDQFRTSDITFENKEQLTCESQLDTGCPVSLVKASLTDDVLLKIPERKWNNYHRINNFKLRVHTINSKVTLDNNT